MGGHKEVILEERKNLKNYKMNPPSSTIKHGRVVQKKVLSERLPNI